MIRTGYSFKRVYGHLKDVLSRLQECGYPAAPIADHCSTFGFVRWNKLCEKAGIKPVFGVELPVTTNLGDKRPILDNWTFIAKDSLRPLHDLIGIATSNAGRDPSLNYRQALGAEGVFKIAGHTARLDEMSPREDLYIGLSPAVNKGFYKRAYEAGFSFLARSDNHYPREEDKEAYRVALGRRSNTQTYPLWILSNEEWHNELSWISEAERAIALDWRNVVMDKSNAKLVKAEMLKPQEEYSLHELCVKGANALGCDLSDPVYSARLERELALIESKGFSDYIFIIADMVNWARQRMIVGPARGSSCGSLVCYLTGITSIDPIPYGLLFERFIDINRNDLPDIDIDFSDERRDLVFQYAEEKYGNDHVGRLGTVGIFRPKSALNQVGESLAIPKWMVEKTADGIINRSGGDSRALQALEDTLLSTDMGRKLLHEFPEARIAIQFEGHPQNASQHAAGIIITEKPLTEYVAVNTRSNAVMCDKKDAEDLNLLKIDALGLTQLSIFERTLELIGEKPKSGFLEKLPLDDQAAFDVLNKGHFAGVFQFMGGALKSLTKQINVTHLEDIVSITALARPGPMATGGANSWVKRKNGQEAIGSLHPMLTELTKETMGITIYQEQVMVIVREMGKMSWEDTSAIRKAMSGRLGNEFFEKFWIKFREGARQNGIEEETAKAVWDQINTFGSWAFNRSHAVAYGVVSYWCCWLKAHHPLEFAAATLDAEKDPEKQLQILRELKDEGIDYLPVDPEHSTDRWAIAEREGRKLLVGPLTQIHGIGPSKVSTILKARAQGEELSPKLLDQIRKGRTKIDHLYPVDYSVKKLHPDLSAIGIVTPPTPINEVQCGIEGNVVIIGVAKKIAPKDENEEVNVKRRGGKRYAGPTAALNLFVNDDRDEIFVKVNRFLYEKFGREIVERGRAGSAIYAIKGYCPKDFRMISAQQIKYLGDLADVKE